MITRALFGLALAAATAGAAVRAGALSASGALAATVVGTAAVAAGWNWGALLIVYFIISTALSHLGRAAKQQRTSSILSKTGPRDATQVFANGAVFVFAAIASLISPDVRWMALGAGALAASAADTWATEVGTLYGGEPRSILTWRAVPAGTSGGITVIGTLAACCGGVVIAVSALALGSTWVVARNVMIGGVAGAIIDSLLGATLQSRRWCESCQLETERKIHTCGTPTRSRRGVQWLGNDMVNLLSNAGGALIAATLSR